MATPRTPKNDGENPEIPDAETLPGDDTPPQDVPAAADPVLILTDEVPRAPESLVETARPENPRQSSAIALVIGGFVAALIGFGLSQIVPKGWPIGSETGLNATVTAQATEIARLSEALKSLPAATPAPDLSPLESQISTLTDRLAAAEAAVAAIPAPVTPPDPGPRLADLEQRIAKLEALPPGTVIEGGTGPDPAAMAALSQEIATLKSDLAAQKGAADAAVAEVKAAAETARAALAEAQAQAQTLRTEAEKATAAATARAALGRIEAAVETGAPFVTAVQALTAAGTEVPAPLADAAATGLPSLAFLQTAFPDAARQALDDSLRAGMGDSTMDRLGAFLRTQTGARSLTPREGADPDAILSRAEAALKAGDLTSSLAEIATLPEAGQAALATWTGAAQARLAATAALATLSAALEG